MERMNFPPCIGGVEADIVYHKGFAYESHTADPELDRIIDKMMDEKELTATEFRALEPVRIPSEDIIAVTAGREGPLH